MLIVKLRGNAQNGSFLAGLVPFTMEAFQHMYAQLKPGGIYYCGFIDSLALYLRKTNDHRGGKSTWAIHEQGIVVSSIFYNNGRAQKP